MAPVSGTSAGARTAPGRASGRPIRRAPRAEPPLERAAADAAVHAHRAWCSPRSRALRWRPRACPGAPCASAWRWCSRCGSRARSTWTRRAWRRSPACTRATTSIDLDLERARQALLLDPRIARAEVTRTWCVDVRVRIVEREPVLVVTHGTPWEVDSAGVLLQPLARGLTADVPLLTGPDFSRQRAHAGAHARGAARAGVGAGRSRRAICSWRSASRKWTCPTRSPRASLPRNGTRVLAPAWPPGARALSALRWCCRTCNVVACSQARWICVSKISSGETGGRVRIRAGPPARPDGFRGRGRGSGRGPPRG